MTLSTIEIDFDIHKLIEAERRSFDEAPFLALRRLLKLPEPVEIKSQASPQQATGRDWQEGMVRVPHGSAARMEYDYGRQVYEGQFLDGKIVVNGKSFSSVSSAAKGLAKTKKGKQPSLNGWNYWKAKFPGESHWRSLDDMRKEARARTLR